jgi:hypothetical protein
MFLNILVNSTCRKELAIYLGEGRMRQCLQLPQKGEIKTEKRGEDRGFKG